MRLSSHQKFAADEVLRLAAAWEGLTFMDTCNVAQRLEKAFGLGSRPTLRKALYARLEQLVVDEGERAYLVIAQCAQDSLSKREPGRYFAHVVICRLIERGIVATPDIPVDAPGS